MTQGTEDADGGYEPSWYPYENGQTTGEIGPARGYVSRDEEWGNPDDEEESDARLTLEQGRADNPGWFVTATLYGWLFHTIRASDESAAVTTFDAVRGALEELSGLLPYDDDRDVAGKVLKLNEAIAKFEATYPGM